MWVPVKYDPASKKKLFLAISKGSALRVLGAYSLVIVRKIGLPPSGSTIGNSALRIRNRLLPLQPRYFSKPRPNLGAPIQLFSRDVDREIVASLAKNCWDGKPLPIIPQKVVIHQSLVSHSLFGIGTQPIHSPQVVGEDGP
jgi:hypothetical protein